MSELQVYEYGPADGPRVLALHGLTGHGKRWETLATEHLPDVRFIAPDLRGHGRSTSLPPWTFEAVVEDLVRLLDDAPAVVVGHSFGGAIAVHMARHRPDLVRALVLLDPAIAQEPGWIGEITDQVLADPDYPDAEAARRDKVESDWGEVESRLIDAELAEHLVTTARGRRTWRMSLPAIISYFGQLARELVLPPASTPTVLVHALDSPWVTPQLRPALAAHLGDRLTVHEFNCGHMVPLALPAETAAIVRSVL
ncbi:alpha/beta fold hydrolase [Nocardia alni]|uniref:alpha/beta fold hydrolase n=1 Tax=Nocardia alni TaxID=2815723 RepID=UPI0027DED53B|nr:alpha/beta hydrolase [Nocardia alni]